MGALLDCPYCTNDAQTYNEWLACVIPNRMYFVLNDNGHMQSQRSSSGFACDRYHSVQSTSCQSQHIHWFIMVRFVNIFRADSRFAPSQWEMALLCNDIFYWLCASLESALIFYTNLMKLFMNTVICFMIVSGAFSFNILVMTINQSVG